MNIFAIIGTGIIAAAIAAILRKFGGETGLFVSLAASLLILFAVISAISPLIDLIGELAEASGTESAYIAILMKALAVCVITQLAAESCRDSGEGAIASKIEFAGKTAVLLVSVPLFSAIFGIVKELIL